MPSPIGKVPDPIPKQYRPRGLTPVLDALGDPIEKADERLARLDHDEDQIVVVLTLNQGSPMYLLSWNVGQLGASKRIEAVANAIGSSEPDIVTIQEVRSRHASTVAEALQGCGLEHVWHSHDPPPCRGREVQKAYHCLIASRWPLAGPHGGDAWRCAAPFPETLGRVAVRTPTVDINVFTAHIPHGSGHGWKKIDTFETLALALRRGTDSPRILTGDFNEPKTFLSSGQLLTFAGEQVDADGSISASCEWWKHRRPREDWSKGVRSVLADASRHGLRDAYRARHGFAVATPVTHRVTKGKGPRCFDHTFVSRHFEVVECGYHHEWRRERWSDHSAMWTKLRLRTEVPPLENWE